MMFFIVFFAFAQLGYILFGAAVGLKPVRKNKKKWPLLKQNIVNIISAL